MNIRGSPNRYRPRSNLAIGAIGQPFVVSTPNTNTDKVSGMAVEIVAVPFKKLVNSEVEIEQSN